MLSARDELRHLADTLTEEQAEKALAAIREAMPELYPDDDDDPHVVVRRGPAIKPSSQP